MPLFQIHLFLFFIKNNNTFDFR